MGMTAPDSLFTIMMLTESYPAGGCLQSLEAHAALRVRLQIGDGKALLLQLLHGMEHGVVLHGRRDDVAAALAQPFGGRKWPSCRPPYRRR